MIGWEQELAWRAACDVTAGSEGIKVGMETWLGQVLEMSQGSK